MIPNNSYRKSFFIALSFHIFLAAFLLFESATQHPVLTKETVNTPGDIKPTVAASQEAVKAVSVDSRELSAAVNRLKLQRENERQVEVNRQHQLNKQAETARQNRLKEQQQLAKLKKETEQLAITRKKQLEEEKRHLKALAVQKEQEAKRITELKKEQEDLKKQQRQETQKLADLQKKQVEKAQADNALTEKIKAAKALADKEKQRQAERALAAENAEDQLRMSGEVDKYKALILNAISRQWILPDNANHSMSSQFRIRLAPDGMVMEVSLTRSSGDPILDRSAQTAIYKASPLPVPNDPAMFNLFRDINLTVRPEQVRG